MKRLPLLMVVLLLAGNLSGQITGDIQTQTAKDSTDTFHGFRMFLTKDISSYLLKSLLNKSLSSDNLFSEFKGDITSGIITGGIKSTRDEYILSNRTSYSLNESVRPYFQVRANTLNDSRSSGIDAFSRYDFGGGIELMHPVGTLSPLFGYSFNKLQSVTDKGLTYGADFVMNPLHTDDYRFNAAASFFNEDISPRRNLNRNIAAEITGGEATGIKTHTQIGYLINAKDFYSQADSLILSAYGVQQNIQSREENALRAENEISLSLSDNSLTLSLNTQYLKRSIERTTAYRINDTRRSASDARISENRFSLIPSFTYTSGIVTLTLAGGYSERSENHSLLNPEQISGFFLRQVSEQEAQKNNTSGRIFLSGSVRYFPSVSDSIEVSFLQNKLQYDTPSSANDDDRDELLSIIRASYSRKFNHRFTASIFTETAISKLVYIPATRSGGNYMNRVIRLGTSAGYTGETIKHTLRSEVSANYTIYDYETKIPTLKSFLFRQFLAADSLAVVLSSSFTGVFTGFIRLSEQGQFFRETFSLSPALKRKELLLNPSVKYRTGSLETEFGIRYFTVISNNLSQILASEDNYKSVGPAISVNLARNELYRASVTAWHEFISRSGSQDAVTQNTNLFISIEIKI